MEEALLTLWNGLPIFLVHSGLSLAILIVGVFLYTRITPNDEIQLVREGNVAAAISLSAAVLGLAIPLAFSLSSSISPWDIIVWGVVALILQLIAFRLVDLFLKDISSRIAAGEVGPAISLLSFKLATAFINAAAITG
jgi:putative membrane protein